MVVYAKKVPTDLEISGNLSCRMDFGDAEKEFLRRNFSRPS